MKPISTSSENTQAIRQWWGPCKSYCEGGGEGGGSTGQRRSAQVPAGLAGPSLAGSKRATRTFSLDFPASAARNLRQWSSTAVQRQR